MTVVFDVIFYISTKMAQTPVLFDVIVCISTKMAQTPVL